MKHWVLIVDAAGSALYETDEQMEAFAEVRHESAEHAVRSHAESTRHSTGVHSAHQRHADVHAHERARFAHQMAEQLDAAERAGKYERLVVVAPPRFLGEIRADLSPRVQHRVVAWIPHDFGHLPANDLPAAVRRHLPDTAGMDG